MSRQHIRDFANAKFVQTLPQFQAGELTGTQFRKAVMQALISEFAISVASASTHYNYSLTQTRLHDAKAVAGLGRPEDKKGGRKAIHTVDVIKVKDGSLVASGVSRGAAELMITQATLKRKAKLAIKAVEAEAEAGAEAGAEAEQAVA